MPGGDKVQIGLVKNIFQFDPYKRWNLVHWILCRLLDHAYNESIIRFLRDGVFKLHFPTQANIYQEYPEAKGATDFIGLNYYSNLIVSPLAKREPPFKPLHRPGQPLTDMPYATYPEGFYRALKRISTIDRPVIVTENGIADKVDDRREDYIRRYIYAMSRAIAEGVDIQGYYYWSLMDNFEWAEGNEMRFGLYEINYDTQERRLREGSKAFADIVKSHANS
jgi:beta-glucosidase